MVRLVFLVSVGLLCFQMPAVLSFTRLLYADVFNSILRFDPDIIPLENEGSPVRVNLSLTLLEISEVDTENNQMEIVAWLETKWRNPAIRKKTILPSYHRSVCQHYICGFQTSLSTMV